MDITELVEVAIAELVDLDKTIDAAEERASVEVGESLRARWEFGRKLLTLRAPPGPRRAGKQLPDGLVARLVEATGKSQAELSYRMQFAERYPTEDKVSNALETLHSWREVIASLPEPAKPRPQRKPSKPREDKHPPFTPGQDAEFGRCREEGMSWTDAEAQVRGFDKPRASLTTEGQQARTRYEQRQSATDAPVINWDSVPGSVREKLEAARRRIRREVEWEFEPRVQAEVQARLKVSTERVRQREADAKRVLDARKGIFTRADYDTIRSCLHPDSRLSVTDAKLARAFRVFNEAEIVLLDEKARPTTLPSLDELLKRRKGR